MPKLGEHQCMITPLIPGNTLKITGVDILINGVILDAEYFTTSVTSAL